MPPLDESVLNGALLVGTRHAVDGVLRVALSRLVAGPMRLLSTRADGPAVAEVLARARQLEGEGVEAPAMVATADYLESARSALDSHRAALAEITIRGAPPEALSNWDGLVRAAHRVEASAWRLAFIVARELGGPGADDTLLDELPGLIVDDAAGLLDRLRPLDPDYPVLVEERRRIMDLAAQLAGAETIVARDPRWPDLRHGDTAEALPSVRQRLAELGEAAPAVGQAGGQVTGAETFDANLDGALRRVQRRHGLLESGTLTAPTLAVLRTPLPTRLAAVDAALHAIRSHPLRGKPDRIQVNIPAYELRVFVAGKLASRHRTVVGNNDTAGGGAKVRHINRTPILATMLTDVVLNPSWFVPRRIKEGELDPIANRNPAFYDDFDLWVGNDGVERAVQLPGRRNALGRVKFVIQGAGGVFLHDTPGKRAFRRRVRAMSHGCVRVEDAVGLMRRVLDHDRHDVDPHVAQAILANGREVIVTLNRPVPVSLEYVTVSVDDEGRVRYHPDVYGWGPVRVADEIIGATNPRL